MGAVVGQCPPPDELDRLRLIKRTRVGNTRLILVSTADVVRVVLDLASRGVFFYAPDTAQSQ